MEKLHQIFMIIGIYECGLELDVEDVEILAYTNLLDFKDCFNGYDVYEQFESKVRDVVFDELAYNGEDWSDSDEDNPNNPHHYGYIYKGETFITGYSGVAGHYWNNDETYTVCKW